MENTGWIKLWRKIQDSPINQDSVLFHIAVNLLMWANHEDKKTIFNGEEITIKRGQLITGRDRIADLLGLNSSLVYRKLKILKNIDFSNIKSNNRYSLITIKNYDSYQGSIDECEQQIEQLANNQRTTSEQQANTSKEIKELKNERIKKNIYTSFLEHWNNKNIIVHKSTAALLQEIERAVNTLTKKYGYTVEDLKQAISNYHLVLSSDKHYFNHKWNLKDFLKRGAAKFVDAADPLNNFAERKGKDVKGSKKDPERFDNFRRRHIHNRDKQD